MPFSLGCLQKVSRRTLQAEEVSAGWGVWGEGRKCNDPEAGVCLAYSRTATRTGWLEQSGGKSVAETER